MIRIFAFGGKEESARALPDGTSPDETLTA
jgi:hypothetical protein